MGNVVSIESGSENGLRLFPDELEVLAKEWAEQVVTPHSWNDQGQQASTESKPRKVECGGILGVAKPGVPKTDNIARAAHEKIASDLAYLLNLPVPPVILWNRGQTCTTERYVCISAWAFPQPINWNDVHKLLVAEQVQHAGRVMSGMRAFETWITATDRKPDHVLAYLPAEDERVQLAFIDYAYSMSYQWKEKDAQAGGSASYIQGAEDKDAAQSVVAAIQQLDEQQIVSTVERIPEEFLPAGPAEIIRENLLSRREKLSSILGLQ